MNLFPRLFFASLLISSSTFGENRGKADDPYLEPFPFGKDKMALECDNAGIGKWWDEGQVKKGRYERAAFNWFTSVKREKALAFALYTVDSGVLKLTAQTFPLYPDEPKSIILETKQSGEWKIQAEKPVIYPGWSAHFRVENWDDSKDVEYRLRLGELSQFEGRIRKNPTEKDALVVASMSCNSPRDKTTFERAQLVDNLIHHDPDLLFFGGDQNYTHDEHTYGWLMWGVQYAEVTKDRPTIVVTDDHDIGHGNLWGEGGKVSTAKGNADGGYQFPASFVNMVQRCEMDHLPDAFDPTPILQGITTHYTDLTWGGISFAILEDRKFKSGPLGKIPEMGPRPDHINNPKYDREAVDLPGLKLLGDRQLRFLAEWALDWKDAEMKVALSPTAFCGAVHLHGHLKGRLLADLDCNGWPQTGRDEALRALRRVRATHLCGDQHLAAVVHHGIDEHRDGPMSFTSPALVNTIYGRWWWPKDEKAGGGDPIKSELPWVGDYEDGLGNKITMMAYANPQFPHLPKEQSRENRGDGYGLARFEKRTGTVTFEAWPRFADVSQPGEEQFEGWPISFANEKNDGRHPIGTLPEVELPLGNAVISVTNDDTGELLYCHRLKNKKGEKFSAPIFQEGTYTVRAGADRPEKIVLKSNCFPADSEEK